jgi:hypothetical protein
MDRSRIFVPVFKYVRQIQPNLEAVYASNTVDNHFII